MSKVASSLSSLAPCSFTAMSLNWYVLVGFRPSAVACEAPFSVVSSRAASHSSVISLKRSLRAVEKSDSGAGCEGLICANRGTMYVYGTQPYLYVSAASESHCTVISVSVASPKPTGLGLLGAAIADFLSRVDGSARGPVDP